MNTRRQLPGRGRAARGRRRHGRVRERRLRRRHSGPPSLRPACGCSDGAGCNVVAVQGPEGSLLVDGGYAKDSKALLGAAAKATGNRKVGTLINTHWHPAQTGSNEAIGREGGTIIAHEVTRLYLGRRRGFDRLRRPVWSIGEGRAPDANHTHQRFAGVRRPARGVRLPAGRAYQRRPVHPFSCSQPHRRRWPGAVVRPWPMLDYRNGAWLGRAGARARETRCHREGRYRVVPANGPPITGEALQRQHRMFATFHEKMVVFPEQGVRLGRLHRRQAAQGLRKPIRWTPRSSSPVRSTASTWRTRRISPGRGAKKKPFRTQGTVLVCTPIVFRPAPDARFHQAPPVESQRLPIRCQDLWFAVCRMSALFDPSFLSIRLFHFYFEERLRHTWPRFT